MKIYVTDTETSFSDVQAQKPFSHLLITSTKVLAGTEEITVSRVHADNAGNEEFIPKISVKVLAELAGSTGQGFYKDLAGGTQVMFPISKKGALEISDRGYVSIDMEGMDSTAVYTVQGIEAANLGKDPISIVQRTVQATNVNRGQMKAAVGEFDAAILPISHLSSIKVFYGNGSVPEYDVAELKAIAITTNDLVKVSKIAGTNLTAIGGVFADLAAARTAVNTLATEVEARLDALEANTMNTYGYGDYLVLQIAAASHIEVITDGSTYTFYTADLT